MPTVDGVEAGLRVTAALDFLHSAAGDDIRDHCVWQLKHVLTDLSPEYLSTATLVSLLAILIPDHARFLAGRLPMDRGPGTVLRLIRDDAG